MTNADLIRGLSDKLGVLNKAAESVIDSVLEKFDGALKHGDRVNISGFATFAVLAREARAGRNPQTGKSIEIPASRTAKFKLGKQLKESLSGAAAAGELSGSPQE
jgi:nucleoid DNA-binding protein